jgi:acyl-CoA thioesterase I
MRMINRRLVNAMGGAVVALILALSCADAQTAAPRLLALGDSLTAGYGLPQDRSFTAQLQAWLSRAGVHVQVINAGVSGDTSAGGLARLDWAMGSTPPQYALVELGANDALRGLSPAALYDNLDKILTRLKAHGVKAMLVGMYAPRNLGRDYDEEFDAVYPRLAKQHGVPLYPFFLDGVVSALGGADAKLIQADGLHPNAEGVAAIVARIGPAVARLINGGQADGGPVKDGRAAK